MSTEEKSIDKFKLSKISYEDLLKHLIDFYLYLDIHDHFLIGKYENQQEATLTLIVFTGSNTKNLPIKIDFQLYKYKDDSNSSIPLYKWITFYRVLSANSPVFSFSQDQKQEDFIRATWEDLNEQSMQSLYTQLKQVCRISPEGLKTEKFFQDIIEKSSSGEKAYRNHTNSNNYPPENKSNSPAKTDPTFEALKTFFTINIMGKSKESTQTVNSWTNFSGWLQEKFRNDHQIKNEKRHLLKS